MLPFRRKLLLVLLGGLLVRTGWLYVKVGGLLASEAWEEPTIVYGRPAAVRPGDDVAGLRLPERLRRLSYRKAPDPEPRPGAWWEGAGEIRIHTRGYRLGDEEHPPVSAVLTLSEGRVAAVATADGAPVETLRLEPEEVARILGPGMEARERVPLGALPKPLLDAVLAAEDARFYRHVGIDLIGVARALAVNIRRGRFAQGGSTITQQLAKNFFLDPRRTLWRKIREAELALLIEARFSKEEILEAYLNKIYLGQEGPRGIYGIEEAARFYFSKGAGELSLEEAALVAGIIRSPNRYSPLKRPDAAKERRDWVLARMRALGTVDEKGYRRAVRAPVRTFPRRVPVDLGAYYVDYLRRAAGEVLGEEPLHRTGYRFHAALDPVHQEAAETAVAEGLAELARGPAAAPGAPPLEAALVAVDPATGELTALVGGRSYGETQFNRAVDARRQPGSAFKPFVLLAALARGPGGDNAVTLATPVSGDPLVVPVPGGSWEPENYEGRLYGTMTVRRAVEESVNTAAVRLALGAGLDAVAAAARDAGIASPMVPVPSLALGTVEVTPLEMAYAYATLAAGGTRHEPFALRAVAGSDGEFYETRRPARAPGAVDPRLAFLVTRALEGVLDRGTGRFAREAGIDFPAAGKTGTTDDLRDSWFVGYSPTLVCAVWVGRDPGGTTGLSGASGALRIWTRFMKAAGRPPAGRGFERPPGIEDAEVDPATGFLATGACPETFDESFIEGTAPQASCPLHPAVPVVDTVRKGIRGLRDFLRRLFE